MKVLAIFVALVAVTVSYSFITKINLLKKIYMECLFLQAIGSTPISEADTTLNSDGEVQGLPNDNLKDLASVIGDAGRSTNNPSYILANIFRVLIYIHGPASNSVGRLGHIVIRSIHGVRTTLESIIETLHDVAAGTLTDSQALAILAHDLNIIVTVLAGYAATVVQAIIVATSFVGRLFGIFLLHVLNVAASVVTAINTVANGMVSAVPPTTTSSIVRAALNTLATTLRSEFDLIISFAGNIVEGDTVAAAPGALLNAVIYTASVITSVVASVIGETASVIAYSSTNVNLAITYAVNNINASGEATF